MALPVAKVRELETPTRNGQNSETNRLHDSLPRRWLTMAKAPTTLPRWALFLSNGALIATVILGAISYGRSAGKTETALANSAQVPQLQAQLTTLQQSIDKIAQNQAEAQKDMNNRVSRLEQDKSSNAALAAKVDALTGQLGSVWATAESSRGDVKELKGKVDALLQLQQRPKENH
jgi:TolA-binding protein